MLQTCQPQTTAANPPQPAPHVAQQEVEAYDRIPMGRTSTSETPAFGCASSGVVLYAMCAVLSGIFLIYVLAIYVSLTSLVVYTNSGISLPTY